MKKNKVCILILIILITVGGFIGYKILESDDKNSRNSSNSIKISKSQSLDELKKSVLNDIQEAENGKYKNLIFEKIDWNMNKIISISPIKIKKNIEFKQKTHEENLSKMLETINRFYSNDFDTSILTVRAVYEKQDDGNDELSLAGLQEKIKNETFNADKYFLLFGDAREKGGRGFVQIDSGFSNVWFSRGNIDSTLPMYSYDIKKVYNISVNHKKIDEKVSLIDGEIAISEAVQYVEKFLNEELPFEKNNEYIYDVAEVRVLDVEGQDALGFCVRRNYNGIPFDYVDGVTDGIFNSDYVDERGEVVIIKKNEVDNFCGLTGANDSIEKAGEELHNIVSLDSALNILSENIGENSTYSVYGIEIVYQISDDASSTEENKIYYGKPVWKIMSKNLNDDKYTWFYVDLQTGELNHRFKEIYGEKE